MALVLLLKPVMRKLGDASRLDCEPRFSSVTPAWPLALRASLSVRHALN